MRRIKKEYIPAKGEIKKYLTNHGIKYEERGENQLLLRPCPFCGSGEKEKDVYCSPCMIDINTGRWQCFRKANCGASGTYKRLQTMLLLRDSGLLTEDIRKGKEITKEMILKAHRELQDNTYIINDGGENKMNEEIVDFKNENKGEKEYKIFRASDLDSLELSGVCADYMSKRGISANTCKQYHVVNSPDEKYKDKYILLPFLDDCGENITYSKYRNISPETNGDKLEPKEIEVSGKACFFGLDNLTDSAHALIITEGPIDCLSLVEAGVREKGYDVLSVPSGCCNMGFIQQDDIDFILTYDKIVVFGDCEKGGISLVSDFEKKLGKRVNVIADYKGCKDANEILVKYGKEVLLNSVENDISYNDVEIRRISSIDLSQEQKEILFTSGFPELDNMLNGIETGNLILLLGKEGSGKTTIATQMLLQAANNGIKSLVYSGEMSLAETTSALYLQAAGPNYVDCKICDRTQKRYGEVKTAVTEKVKSWLDRYIFLYEDRTNHMAASGAIVDPSALMNRLLDVVERQIYLGDIRFVVIDNMMSALAHFPEGSALYAAQAELAMRLSYLCKKYNVTIMLCVHSRKLDKGSLHLMSDDISGSSIPKNMADIIISYEKYRQSKEDKDGKKKVEDTPSGYLRVLKNRHWGAVTTVDNDGEGVYYLSLCRQLMARQTFVNLKSKLPIREYGWTQE